MLSSLLWVLWVGQAWIGGAWAESRWATAAAEGARWPGGGAGAAVTLRLEPGEEVELLAMEGDLARVRKGADFGWVPASALTEVAPPKPEAGGLPFQMSP